MALRKAGVSLYEVDGSTYFVERARGRWDAYLPTAYDMRVHLWESLAHTTRSAAVSAVRAERRRIYRALHEILR